jgi:serine/threonine-protein kinase
MAAQDSLNGRYRLAGRLGAGGMSVVWSGFDNVLQRRVAVKLPAPGSSGSTGGSPGSKDPTMIAHALRQRIQREARSAARMSHPHIVSVYDYGEAVVDEDSSPFLVMELVAGQSLAARLAERGRLPWREATTICAQVASALAEVHANDVVHRDVKPANVLLSPAGAKLVDFGIAASVGETEGDSELLGTPAYMAPERLAGTPIGTAADVYALGLVLYRALSGAMPWDADSVPEVLSAHLASAPAPLPDLPELPDEVVRICQACLEKEPASRPSSVDVAQTLAGAAGVVVPLPDPARRWYAAAAAAGAAVATGATRLGLVTRTLVQAPEHLLTSVVAGGSSGLRRSWVPRGPARLALGTAAAFVGTLVLVAATASAWGRPGGTTQLGALGPVIQADPFQCGVSYQVESARSDRFDAVVEVTHAGGETPESPVLRFAFPGDQSITDIAATGSTQSGQEVTTSVGDWSPSDTVTLRLADTRGSYNPMPTTFFVNDTRCAAVVSGPPTPIERSDEDSDDSGHGPGNRGRGRDKDRDDDDDD